MFQDWFPTIPELIASTDEADILTTDLYDRPPKLPWTQQRLRYWVMPPIPCCLPWDREPAPRWRMHLLLPNVCDRNKIQVLHFNGMRLYGFPVLK